MSNHFDHNDYQFDGLRLATSLVAWKDLWTGGLEGGVYLSTATKKGYLFNNHLKCCKNLVCVIYSSNKLYLVK